MMTFSASAIAQARRRGHAFFGLLAAIGAVSLTAAGPSHAVTTGATQVQGSVVLSAFNAPTPMNATNPPGPVDLRPTSFSYIRNEYMGVVQGEAGSGNWTWNIGNNITLTFRPRGRIVFGNTGGRLRDTLDDTAPLTSDGWPLWPLAGDYTQGGGFNATGFVAVNVVPPTVTDPTNLGTTQVLGIQAGSGAFTQFRDNALISTYNAANGIRVVQTIRIRRSAARMEWVITNTGTAIQRVGLLFVNSLPFEIRNYVHPTLGRTDRPALFTGGTLPARLEFSTGRVNPVSHSDFIFRGFDATPPAEVLAGAMNSFFDDEPAFRLPSQAINDYPTISSTRVGASVASYWSADALQPGQSRTIVTYLGNGSDTESYAGDYVAGVDAIESLQYNADAINTLTASERASATLRTGTAFLSPRPIQVFGSVYNQTPSTGFNQVPIPGVSMSLTLPLGLEFARDSSGTQDTATKTVGTVQGDIDAPVQWNVNPTGDAYGTLTYQMSVATGAFPGRSISRNLNVPAMPIRQMPSSEWQLISFPFAFDATLTNNGNPSSVLNGITSPTDPIGGVVPIYAYDPLAAQNGGSVYSIATSIVPGRAYFYKPSLTRTVFLNGAVPLANQAPAGDPAVLNSDIGTPYQVTVQRGWNMIGNPFLYDIPLGFIRAVPLENNPTLRSFTFAEAATAGIFRGAVFFYTGENGSGNGYDFLQSQTEMLHPWVGYWLYANSPVLLTFPAPHQINALVTGNTPTSRGTAAGAVATRNALVKNPTLDNWKLQIAARTRSGREDNATLLGVHREAQDTDDIRDLPKPPAYRSYVYVGVVREGAQTRFAQDVRKPGRRNSWEFEVTTDQEGPVTLSWPNLATLPRRLRFELTDLASGQTVKLRSASSHTFTASNETTYRFRLVAEETASQPLAIVNMHAVQTRATGGFSIRYDLTSSATVSARVLTLGGKTAANIQTGRASEAGQNTLRWNGRSQDGASLPAGAYVIEVTARSDEGDMAVQKAPVLVLR